MSDITPDPPTIGVLTLKPGDVVVVQYKQRLSAAHAEYLAHKIKEAIGGEAKCIVLDSDAELNVLRRVES